MQVLKTLKLAPLQWRTNEGLQVEASHKLGLL